MVPGGFLLALLRVFPFPLPDGWVDIADVPANPVAVPALLLGVAYVLGTVLEIITSRRLEAIFIAAFGSAATTYPWRPGTPKVDAARISAKDLSRASFGYLIPDPAVAG